MKLGVRKSDDHKCAIKIVDKHNTNAREMFKELEIMSRLQHENIVCFEELFDERDGFYVVMELYVNDYFIIPPFKFISLKESLLSLLLSSYF